MFPSGDIFILGLIKQRIDEFKVSLYEPNILCSVPELCEAYKSQTRDAEDISGIQSLSLPWSLLQGIGISTNYGWTKLDDKPKPTPLLYSAFYKNPV